MRMSVCVVVATFIAAVAGSAAMAGTIKLQGTYNPGQIEAACIKVNGTPTGSAITGSYGCHGPKGDVNCTKDGKCEGTCEKCGTRVGGKVPGFKVDGVLANAPDKRGVGARKAAGARKGMIKHTATPTTGGAAAPYLQVR